MTTDEQVIAQLAEANPIRETGPHTSQEHAEAERILRRVLDEAPSRGPRRPRIGVLVPVASLLVVLVVAAALLRTGGTATTPGTSRTILSRRSWLWSTTTMISWAGTICVWAEAMHSVSQSQRSSR